MILADINWLNLSITLLLFVFVIISVLLILLILMQRPKQEGLGAAFGGGVTDQVFGARTTNVLQRGTVYLGSLFFLLALVISLLISRKNASGESLVAPEQAEAPPAAEQIVVEPEVPRSLAEELGIGLESGEALEIPVEEGPAETTPTEPEISPVDPEEPESEPELEPTEEPSDEPGDEPAQVEEEEESPDPS